MKGSYILVLQLDAPLTGLAIGRLGRFDFASGYYIYVGSAFGSGGIEARLAHHRRREKLHPHWNIDYLRAHTRLREAWTVAGPERLECRWCKAMAAHPALSIPAPRFGSRDTGCAAHLFYLPHPPRSAMLTAIILGGLTLDQPLDLQIEVHSFDD